MNVVPHNREAVQLIYTLVPIENGIVDHTGNLRIGQPIGALGSILQTTFSP